MKNGSTPKVVLIVLLCLLGTTHATVWYVHPDSTLNTIQGGLNACSTGDTVLVGPGGYVENIIWPATQGINLISEYGPDTTIIDGDSEGITISITSGIDSTTIIHGFTIQGGFSSDAGGIYCYNNSSPTIDSNVITKNVSTYSGGGIACDGSSPIITNNMITGNTTPYGGGIECFNYSAPTITNNIITLNTSGDLGGGILCVMNSSPIIDSNTISYNHAAVYGGGILCMEYCSPIITGNFITGNTADSGAGGIGCILNSSPTIINNIITGNDGDILGGGITAGNSSPLIEGCEISSNIGDGVHSLYASNPVLRNNNIFDNTGYGVCNENSSIIVDADSNWWGDSTGPYHSTLNPTGLGDSVSDYVDFDPWLLDPVFPGIEEHEFIRQVTTTLKIFPNPFSKLTHIKFQAPSSKSQATMNIYDATGRLVRQWDYPTMRLSDHIKWDGTDHANRQLPSGVYFLKISAGDYQETEKLLLIK